MFHNSLKNHYIERLNKFCAERHDAADLTGMRIPKTFFILEVIMADNKSFHFRFACARMGVRVNKKS